MTDQDSLNISPQTIGPGTSVTRSPVRNSQSSDKAENSKQDVQRLNAETNAIKQRATEAAHLAKASHERSVEVIADVASDLDDAIEILNESLAKTPTKAVISKDEDLNRYIVKIADKRSGEIVREIPPEALLKFARHLQELKGILFDEQS